MVLIFESVCILIYLTKLRLFATWIGMVLSLSDFVTFENPRRILQRSTIFPAVRKLSNLVQHEWQWLRRTRKPLRMSFETLQFLRKNKPVAKPAIFPRNHSLLSFFFTVLDSAVQNESAVYDNWFSGSLTPAFQHKWYFKNLRHLDPVCGGMDLSLVIRNR